MKFRSQKVDEIFKCKFYWFMNIQGIGHYTSNEEGILSKRTPILHIIQ